MSLYLSSGFYTLSQITSVVLLVLGFGFVIFFHELGHFLAAKWVGIKVEQFAVGFGQALFSWRKGMGIRFGSSGKEYNELLRQHQEAGNEGEPALGETEYRLNWIPLGGYVKMLGQDDLRPDALADDPRAFNRKSVPARMLVVSAGVIMNIILAGIGFMALFMMGFHVPPAVVGNVATGSPAQNTVRLVEGGSPQRVPLQVGDRILDYNGKPQYDFTEIGLSAALSEEGARVPITVRHLDGTQDVLQITPVRDEDGTGGFLSFGISAPRDLKGPELKSDETAENWQKLLPDDADAVKPGDVITQINGQDVKPEEFYKLDRALQASDGKPIVLTVRSSDGKTSRREVNPHFERAFGSTHLNFAGLQPRPAIGSIGPKSPARDKLMPGDVIVSITSATDPIIPSAKKLTERLNSAGQDGKTVDMIVLRKGQAEPVHVDGLTPSMKVAKDRKGLGVALDADDQHTFVADVEKDSPADKAGIPAHATITAVGGTPVSNWFQFQQQIAAAQPGKIAVAFTTADGKPETRELAMTSEQIDNIRDIRRAAPYLALAEHVEVRKAPTPWVAAKWGVAETRDFILQFYLTLRRMVGGSVSPSQMMGPVGIFIGGAKFAFKGTDWLIWFLAMISANLAVVNFLPIPIVDGGLFTFLILEKIQGRPLSARTHAIAQYVGLAFLAGVFLFVTYHDITRWF